MAETDFEGPPGTLSHHEGEPVDTGDADQLEPDDTPEGAVRPQGDDDDADDADAGQHAGGSAGGQGGPQAADIGGMTPEALEAAAKKIDQAANTYRRRIESLLGADNFAVLVPCELCSGDILGFHYPPELMIPESDLDQRLIEALAGPARPEYVDSPDRHMCDVCNGYGEVLTGSKVPGKGRIKCATCRGYGFTPPLGIAHADPGSADADLEPPAPAAPLAVADQSDAWGSPKYLDDGQENPNWGRMPQYKDPNLP